MSNQNSNGFGVVVRSEHCAVAVVDIVPGGGFMGSNIILRFCELLNEAVDESDPDLDEPEVDHLLHMAETIREDYPNEDYLGYIGLRKHVFHVAVQEMTTRKTFILRPVIPTDTAILGIFPVAPLLKALREEDECQCAIFFFPRDTIGLVLDPEYYALLALSKERSKFLRA
ncbi:inositol oxygenase 4 [Artemisia annua]|uniref:Inositol oxygenase n=1 Tax=Artemisia annua TaxID=35608 RepID=A0A2U1P440_ARTAN|nr:inositol oxygenase 4 [Artemisia annua]